MLSLVFLINSFLSVFPYFGSDPISLQKILGFFFAPLMWFTGMSWTEALITGGLMGTKTVFNEFIAFLNLSQIDAGLLSDRTKLITIYALSGFANFGSLGIMVMGLTSLVPRRRTEILELGPKSLVSGTLATLVTAAVIGLVA
jgi:CNT family concentrative nucleoside transporter